MWFDQPACLGRIGAFAMGHITQSLQKMKQIKETKCRNALFKLENENIQSACIYKQK